MTDREQFEAWRKDRLTMDGYPQFSAEDAWVAAWNASRRAAIEDIAAVLASEIECGLFEAHVAPALDVVRKVIASGEKG